MEVIGLHTPLRVVPIRKKWRTHFGCAAVTARAFVANVLTLAKRSYAYRLGLPFWDVQGIVGKPLHENMKQKTFQYMLLHILLSEVKRSPSRHCSTSISAGKIWRLR